MTIRCTGRHMAGGDGHTHIESLRWVADGKSETQTSASEILIKWIKNNNGQAYVVDGNGDRLWVAVVEADPPYLQTQKDGAWTDNLLGLPIY